MLVAADATQDFAGLNAGEALHAFNGQVLRVEGDALGRAHGILACFQAFDEFVFLAREV